MTLGARLARLERLDNRTRDGCDACRDWPPCRTIYENDWREPDPEPDPYPAACRGCGRVRREIIVEYVHDWRAVT